VEERRKFRRWNCGIACRCLWNGTEREATLENLSFNGALVTGMEPVPRPGEGLLVKLQLPHGEAEVGATVIFSRPGAFGIQFEGERAERFRALMPLFMDYLEHEGLL
jgi:hypothetical protein